MSDSMPTVLPTIRELDRRLQYVESQTKASAETDRLVRAIVDGHADDLRKVTAALIQALSLLDEANADLDTTEADLAGQIDALRKTVERHRQRLDAFVHRLNLVTDRHNAMVGQVAVQVNGLLERVEVLEGAAK